MDLPGAEMGKVVVRFPPEASGYMTNTQSQILINTIQLNFFLQISSYRSC